MVQTDPDLIATLQGNWALEMDGADMYAALAAQQSIPERRAIFSRLADIERKHAVSWEGHLRRLGAGAPARVPTAHSAPSEHKRTMQETVLAIEAEERDDVAAYLEQMRQIEDDDVRATLRDVILDEFAHAFVLRRLYAESADRSVLDYVVRRQRQGTGSWIGDAVYGVNDGLGSIFGIVSGVSGATLGDSRFVLLAGMAGMVASALSMGSGAFLAAKSEREIYEAALHHERTTLEAHPEDAIDELAIFYRLKGVPEADALSIAKFLAARPEQFLATMAAEKLNITADGLANPTVSALSGMVSTAIGAFIPIIPFFFMSGVPAVVAAAIVSLVAHFAVGAAKSLVTVRSWWSSGLEMTWVGAIEGVVTYVIGIGLGAMSH